MLVIETLRLVGLKSGLEKRDIHLIAIRMYEAIQTYGAGSSGSGPIGLRIP